MVSLVLVIMFYTVFFLGRGKINLDNLLGQGTLILGSVVLYELMAFVFYELFNLVEFKAFSMFEKESKEIEISQESDQVLESDPKSDKS